MQHGILNAQARDPRPPLLYDPDLAIARDGINQDQSELKLQMRQIFEEAEERMLVLLQRMNHEQRVDNSMDVLMEAGAACAGDAAVETQAETAPAMVSFGEQQATESPLKPADMKNSDGESIGLGETKSGYLQLIQDFNLDKNAYRVEDFYKKSGWAQQMARSDLFTSITLAFITVNALYLGFDADLNTTDILAESDPGWIICENIFAAFFTCEILVRFLAFEKKANCLQDFWFTYDSCLVVLMIVEVWGMLIAAALGAHLAGIPTAPLRLLRLLRLSRLVRLMRSMPELVTMVKGMRVASRAVASSVLMVLFLVYVFSIVMLMVCESLTKNDDENSVLIRNSFGRLSHCMWTMLLDGTFMTETGPVLLALRETDKLEGYFAVAIFLLFVLLSALTVLNMLIGVLCEVVTSVGQHERDEADVRLVKRGILKELLKFDNDFDGTISKTELERVMRSDQAKAVLEDLEVDASALDNVHEMLFSCNTEKVPIRTVMESCLTYRGNQPPTVKHLVDGMVFNRHYTEQVMKNVAKDLTLTVARQHQELVDKLSIRAEAEKPVPTDAQILPVSSEPAPGEQISPSGWIARPVGDVCKTEAALRREACEDIECQIVDEDSFPV